MPEGDIIFQRLEAATDAETAELCKILKITKTNNPGVDKTHIIIELRKAAGNSVMNLFRRDPHALPYKRILIDVADKLHPGFGWTKYKMGDDSTEEQLEDEINKRILERWQEELEKLSPEEREQKAKQFDEELRKKGVPAAIRETIAGAITGAAVGALGANYAALALFYSGTFWGVYASVFGVATRFLIAAGAAMAGIGLLVGILFAAVFHLPTPAYQKTIPAVLVLIRIRFRLKAEKQCEED